jgi:hypothetical protein
MSSHKPSVDPSPEADKHGPDYADAVSMGRWVVGIVAAMLTYGYTSQSTVANVAPVSYPSTTGTMPASHKVNRARSP